eukprot:TRINITY_DN98441_c0_g1_i1.p2 TRINITY_DN98441_c0_g1~~TRINITY_DN98441_c0_g1_i1.p2  ORF type:complete len:155 (+),score=40.29 TRINITY_DN98441_c0_g1_i1:23-466(+)
MAFDAELTPAYDFLTQFAWMLGFGTGDKGILSLAWSLLNDAFSSEVCVMWAPERLALGCLLLSVEMGRRVPELQAQADNVARRLDRLLREPQLEDFLGLGQGSGADEIEDLSRDLLAVYEEAEAARQRGKLTNGGGTSPCRISDSDL